MAPYLIHFVHHALGLLVFLIDRLQFPGDFHPVKIAAGVLFQHIFQLVFLLGQGLQVDRRDFSHFTQFHQGPSFLLLAYICNIGKERKWIRGGRTG